MIESPLRYLQYPVSHEEDAGRAVPNDFHLVLLHHSKEARSLSDLRGHLFCNHLSQSLPGASVVL